MSGFQKIGTASLSIVPDFDGFVSELRAKLESVRAELDIPVDAELGQFFSALERARERAERTKADLNIGADDAAARAKLDELKAQAARGGDFNLGLDSARAAAEYLAFKEMVERGADMPIRIRIDRSQLDEIRRLSGSISGGGKNDIIPDEGNTRRSKNEVNGLANALERLGRVANRNRGISLRNIGPIGISAISAAVVGLTGDLAGLVGMAGAAAGALASIGAGIGVGLSGVGAALSALRSAPSGASAAVTAKEQAQSLADAQHSVEAAQRAVANATQDTTDKYKAQGEAIRDAGRELRDLNDQLKDAELSQEGAAISAARAEERYQETLQKYRQGRASGLDLQEADFNRRSAQQRLREAQSDLIDQREDTSEANRLGIAGNPKVVAANKAVTDSIQAQKDARYDLAKAISALEIATQKASIGSKFDEAMAKLSPNAKQFINDLRSLGATWTNVRLATQDSLFAGLGPTIKDLAGNQLPAVSEGLTRMAGLANGVVKQSLADLDAQFTANANNGTFRDFLRATEESFAGMPNFIAQTSNAIVNMTRIAGPSLGQTFSALGTGLNNSSGTFGNLGKLLEEQMTRGFQGMPTFLARMEGPLRAGMEMVARVFSTFGRILTDNAPELERFISAVSDSLLPVIERMAQLLAPVLTLFTELFEFMGSIPTETAMALALLFVGKSVAGLIGPMASAYKGMTALGTAMTGFGSKFQTAALGATAWQRQIGNAGAAASSFATNFGNNMRLIGTNMQGASSSLGSFGDRFRGLNGSVAGSQSALRSFASFIGPGGAFMIAMVAAVFVLGEMYAANRKQAQAAEDARRATSERAAAQEKLNKALRDSQGIVTPDVTAAVSGQLEQLRKEAEATKKAAPGWFETFSSYLNGDQFGFGAGADTGRDERARHNAGVRADSLLQTLQNTGLTDDQFSQGLTGNDADFNALISKVRAVKDGGEDAAKEIEKLRQNFLHTQAAAKTLTPGVDTLAEAMKTLASHTATAEEKSRALQTALDLLAGKAPDQTKALQGYGDAARSMIDSLSNLDKSKGFGSSLLGKDGSLDVVGSANASSALNYLMSVRNALTDMKAAGNLTEESYTQALGRMTQYLQGLGLSAEQARVILDKNLGLNDAGGGFLLNVSLTGAKQTEQNLQALVLKLKQVGGQVEISPQVATEGVRDELSRLQGVVVEELSNGNFKITADTAEAQQRIQDVIDRNVFLDKMKAGPHATLVTDDFIRKYIETQQALDKIDKTKVNPEVAVVMEKFRQGKLETEISLDEINKLRANPAIDADTKAALDKLAALKAEAAKGADLPLRVRLEQDQKLVDQGVAQLYSQPGTQKKLAEQGYTEDQIKRLVAANNGTYVPPEKRAGGGPVYGPGTGNVDTIPALLANEEYVQTADAHRYYGTEFMDAVRDKKIPRGFNVGGSPASYGLPGNTQISYGQSDKFPEWVRSLESRFGVKASTYAGHQTSDRGEAGYAPNPDGLNRGIDFSGSVAQMQAFAEYLRSIAPTSPGLEQVIWQNPQTGQKIGWAGRSDVSSTGYFAADYGGHQDHVHLRASAPVGVASETLSTSTGTQSAEQAAAQKKITELQGQIDALVQGNPDKAEKLADVQKLTTQWAILKEQEKNLTADQQKQMKDYEEKLQALYASETDPSVLQAVSGLTATKRQADKELAALNSPSSSLVGTTPTGANGVSTTSTTTTITKPQLNASGLSFDGGLTRLGEVLGNSFFPAGSVLNPSGYDKDKATGVSANALNPAPATNANGQYTQMPGGPLPLTGGSSNPMSIFTPGSGVAGANGLNAIGLPEYTGITPGAALGKLGGIIGGGILAFFGLENSIFSSSNPYNQAIQKAATEGWRAWGPNVSQTTTTSTPNVGTGDPSDPRTTALLNGTPAGTSGLATAGITTPSGSGSQVAPSANYSGGDAATHNAVYTAFVSAGYSPSEWNDLVTIINRESGWNSEARNPGSGAYGLAQFLPGTGNIEKYLGGASSGVPASTQAQGMMQYIKDRYGTPAKAKAFWDANGWYDNGGYLQPGTTLVHNETGKPEPVFTAPQWQTIQGAVEAAQNPPDQTRPLVQNTAQQLSPEIPGVIGQGKGSGANGSVTAAITGGLSSWAGGLLDQGAGSIGSIVSGIGGAAGGAAGGPLAGVAGGASFAAGGAKLGMDIASKAATKFVSSLGSGLGLGGNEVANLFQMTQIGKNTGIDGAPVQGPKQQAPAVNTGSQGGTHFHAPVTVESPDHLIAAVDRREQQQSQAGLATAPR
ncbi:hypothetical protein [Tsukamurella paurometabola]|uniref:Tape measure protein n=1 Tax=Tsukamurella paurometabola TaxID=2061 RepID=A0ABS5NG69_TSUPA|nr:hypothetical protein [Tsukamurella paurometabola]MBS4103273.1 hypothetical protein [Tsukamurella paurometabola]